jgi:hypothetical protein
MDKEQIEKIADIILGTNPEISSRAEATKIARGLVEHGVHLIDTDKKEAAKRQAEYDVDQTLLEFGDDNG